MSYINTYEEQFVYHKSISSVKLSSVFDIPHHSLGEAEETASVSDFRRFIEFGVIKLFLSTLSCEWGISLRPTAALLTNIK